MLFKGALVFQEAKLHKKDVLISDGRIKSIATSLECPDAEIVDATDCVPARGNGHERRQNLESGHNLWHQ